MNDRKIKILDAERDGSRIREILDAGGCIPLVVTGSSMIPLLRHERDLVWLKKKEKITRGMIVLFMRDDGTLILHRVRRVLRNGKFLMNGDAQTWCEVIRGDQIVGTVTHIVRDGRMVSCDRFALILWNILWYPTRAVRPFIFGLYGKLFGKRSGGGHE